MEYIIKEKKVWSNLLGEHSLYGAVAKNIFIRYFMPMTWSNSREHCKRFIESLTKK